MAAETLFEKIWKRHVVVERDDGQCLLYIDRHLCHDGSFNGFRRLRAMNRGVARPTQTSLIPDHYTPTHTDSIADIEEPRAREIVAAVDSGEIKHALALSVLARVYDLWPRPFKPAYAAQSRNP